MLGFDRTRGAVLPTRPRKAVLAARALVEGFALTHPRPFEFAQPLGLPGRVIVVVGMGMIFGFCRSSRLPQPGTLTR